MMGKQYIFHISDGTGITAETLGNSLLSQFENISYEIITLPYIDNLEKAHMAVEKINNKYKETGTKPIVFATLVDQKIRHEIEQSQCKFFEFFNMFLEKLSIILNSNFSDNIGRSHGITSRQNYNTKIEAIDYALQTDDGMNIHKYKEADVIIIGPSRAGKTPTCLYLALQYGINAANFPVIAEEFYNSNDLNTILQYKNKLFGLTINPKRLNEIRSKRFNNSGYSSIIQCQKEIIALNTLYKEHKISCLDTTSHSIEEVSTKILSIKDLKRRPA